MTPLELRKGSYTKSQIMRARVKVLGSGSFGTVYAGILKGGLCSIKEFPMSWKGKKEWGKEWTRHKKAYNALPSKAKRFMTVPIAARYPFIVTELVGWKHPTAITTTLNYVISDASPKVQKRTAKLIPVAVRAFLSAGVVHRDISEANIMVVHTKSRVLDLKIIDYGMITVYKNIVKSGSLKKMMRSKGLDSPEVYWEKGVRYNPRAPVIALHPGTGGHHKSVPSDAFLRRLQLGAVSFERWLREQASA